MLANAGRLEAAGPSLRSHGTPGQAGMRKGEGCRWGGLCEAEGEPQIPRFARDDKKERVVVRKGRLPEVRVLVRAGTRIGDRARPSATAPPLVMDCGPWPRSFATRRVVGRPTWPLVTALSLTTILSCLSSRRRGICGSPSLRVRSDRTRMDFVLRSGRFSWRGSSS